MKARAFGGAHVRWTVFGQDEHHVLNTAPGLHVDAARKSARGFR